jgi:serine/threonine protein kinase
MQLRSMSEEDLRSYRYLALEVFVMDDPAKGRYISKSDMYAFGLLIWEILRGRVVFEDDFNTKKCHLNTAADFMEYIRTRRPVLPISELCLSDLNFVDHFVNIQNQCWEFDPNKRISSDVCMGLVRRDPRPPPMPVSRF